jgi:O-antigen ligase
MLVAMVEGAAAVLELRGSMVARSQGTFPNPNLAASYLGMSLFLVCQAGPRVRWPWRLLFLVPVIGGTLATKSLSAVLACTVGGLVIGAVGWARGSGALRRRVAVLGVALLVAVLVMIPMVLQMEHFLERLPRSAGERTVVWSAAARSFLSNPLGLGVGPAGFREVGYVQGGQFGVGRRISLHDDYLAFLVERGVIGFAGLVLLLVALAAAIIRASRDTASDDEVMRVAGLAAMFVFTLVDSMTHEVTHYRHVWLVWALILALESMLRRARTEVPSALVGQRTG